MTREEAIEILKDCELNPCVPKDKEAADMAIKALKQEPCDDCISRQAVFETIDNRIEQLKKDVNEINKSYSHLSFAEGVHDGYCRLKCDLRILPSVTPQPKTEVLDKIRAEIAEYGSIMVSYAINKDTKTDKGIEKLVSGVLKQVKEQVLEVIDKYKAESEV